VGFVVDKAALGQIFSEYFGFRFQSFHQFLHHHNHPRLAQNSPISGRTAEWTQLDSTPHYTKAKDLSTASYLGYTAQNGRMTDESSSCVLIQVTFRHLPGGTEESHERFHPRQRVSRARFEPSTCRIRIEKSSRYTRQYSAVCCAGHS
jgi:hypothetical protein